MAYQDFTGGCEHQLLRQALKQRCTQLRFQRQNLAADRGGRDVEVTRGFADRAGARDLVDIAEQPAVQHSDDDPSRLTRHDGVAVA